MIDLLRIGFDERISADAIAEGLRRHAGDVAGEDVDELAAVLAGYLRAVPDALEAALAMSKDRHFGRAVAFATGTILTYIFDEEDLLPEASYGVVGLLDDAYLVHGFVDSLRRMYPLAATSTEYSAPDARTTRRSSRPSFRKASRNRCVGRARARSRSRRRSSRRGKESTAPAHPASPSSEWRRR